MDAALLKVCLAPFISFLLSPTRNSLFVWQMKTSNVGIWLLVFVCLAVLGDLIWHVGRTYIPSDNDTSDKIHNREIVRKIISENWCPCRQQSSNSRHLIWRQKHVSGRTVLSRKKLAARIIVSEKLKLVYCPIPKAASSTWKYLIRQQEGIEDYWNLTAANSPTTSGLKYLVDYPSEELERILTSPEYFKFTFVRNPYTRMLSCYLDKFQNKKKESSEYKKFMGHLLGWWDENVFENYSLTSEEKNFMKKHKFQNKILKGPRPSFSQFVRTATRQKRDRMNEHWAPQWYICGMDIIPYDFVGKLEHLEEHAQVILSWIGNSSSVHLPASEEIGFPSTQSRVLEDAFFDINLMFLIRKAFAPDFKIFGYNFVHGDN